MSSRVFGSPIFPGKTSLAIGKPDESQTCSVEEEPLIEPEEEIPEEISKAEKVKLGIIDSLNNINKSLKNVFEKILNILDKLKVISLWILLFLLLLLIYFIIRKYIKFRNELSGHIDREGRIAVENRIKNRSKKANIFEKGINELAFKLAK